MNTAAPAAKPANNNAVDTAAPTVTRDGATVVYRNLADRDRVQFGRKFSGSVAVGQHAAVEKNARIVLWGVNTNRTTGLLPYRTEFKLGDTAVCGSYNLIYTGTIVAIGEKTITVEEYAGTCNARKHRMTIAQFSARNRHYDAEYIFKNNSEWRD